MKKTKLFLFVALIALIACLFAVSAAADKPAATDIVGHNLALEENVQIVYYVDETVPAEAESGVLFWLAPQDEYVYGSETYKVTESYGTIVHPVTGHTCQKYAFTELSAKMMTVDVYAVSYVKNGESITYSTLDKYSILQYCFTKKESKSVMQGGAVTLGDLVAATLQQGAMAQLYFGYKTDRLANNPYYQITVAGGTLPDGTAKGLYQQNDIIVLTADDAPQYKTFAGWKNSAGEPVATTVTGFEKDEEFTSHYLPFMSFGLTFVSNGDGTCYVSGIGSCTDTDLSIPTTSLAGDTVTAIGADAFRNCSTLTSVVIPETVTKIGLRAFLGCSNLKSVLIGDSVIAIGQGAFCDCTSLVAVTIGENVETIGNSAFNGCKALTNIAIPEYVVTIGEYAFSSCSVLTKMIYAGYALQWDTIGKGTKWDAYINQYEMTFLQKDPPAYQRINQDGTENENGNFILFGSYPQSEVTNLETRNILNERALALSIPDASQLPTLKEYIVVDLIYHGEQYRGLYASYPSNAAVYWFRYEPLKWRILENTDGTALILCENIIDGKQFYPTDSDHPQYSNSTVRTWLNESFYETSFDTLQESIIAETLVDGTMSDNIFLLSKNEVGNDAYGFSSTARYHKDSNRQKQSTDYGKINGVITNNNGTAEWWLRSRYSALLIYMVEYVDSAGDASYAALDPSNILGVVPALRIML